MSNRMEQKVKELIRQERLKTIEGIQKIELERILDRGSQFIELGVNDPETLINVYLYGFIERSFRIRRSKLYEEIALIASGGEDYGKKVGDILVEQDGIEYLVEIKSGRPRRKPPHYVQSLVSLEEELDFTPILGYVHGGSDPGFEEDLVEFNIRILAGKAFWEFLSGDPDFYHKLIDWMEESMYVNNITISDALTQKRQDLLHEWKDEFGQSSIYDIFRKEL